MIRKYRKTILIIFCCVLVFSNKLLAQDSLDINIDYTRFFENDDYSFVEIYYSFSRSSIEHSFDGENYLAEYSTKLDIYLADSLLNSYNNKLIDRIHIPALITSDMWISDIYQLILKKGTFKIDFFLTDLNTSIVRQKSFEIENSPLKTDTFFLSDLQLALDIKRTTTKSRFIKNGYQITPNPAKIYGIERPVLFYYCEIYSSAAKNMIDSCQIISEILDLQGNQIKKFSSRNKTIDQNGIVEINKVLVGSLSSGSYYLKVSLTDGSNSIYDSKRKLFYVYREADYLKPQSSSVASIDDLLQRYQIMTEADINLEFAKAEYIATPTEIDIFSELDLDAKRTFLVQFWDRRKQLSSPKYNNFRAEYLQRVEYANSRFTSGGKDGWEQDRGRTILKYGIPDDIERFFGGRENIQYETWTYNELQGRVQFFFVDISRYGIYRLVHSTMLNEIKDYEWRNRFLR